MHGGRDLHKSLKSEVLGKANASGLELVLVKLAWGKNDSAFSLHVAPRTWSTYGIQIPDLLNYLGFSRQACLFLPNECYVREVNADFDLNAFGAAFGRAYRELTQAQDRLEACGFMIGQPEGWGYFFGKRSSSRRERRYYHGDGHTSATTPKRMKAAEDDVFHFIFTWIKNSDIEKGWTIHYKPKHPPLSVELQGVFTFLGVKEFRECPEFNFESCNWRYIEFHQRGEGGFDDNAEAAHKYFDAHAENFSPGVKLLLAAQAQMEQFGMGFLPSFGKPEMRRVKEISRRVVGKSGAGGPARQENPTFDVAFSFARTERKYAEDLANRIKDAGFEVFYDRFYPEDLWGKDLVEFFHDIYSRRSRYCVIFVSNEYLSREWTVHERRSAQERMLKEKGSEYILPIKVEEVDLPGIPGTIGYLPIGMGIEKVADILVKKLQKK